MKIVLAGPPRSGKSCLREGLKQAIRAIKGAPYPYVITACPDGEGAWFQAAVGRSPEAAACYKAAYKTGFTPAFVQRVSENVDQCQEPLTLVDIGGIPSKENEQICRGADSIILLAGDTDTAKWTTRLEPWYHFAVRLQLNVVAVLESRYHDVADHVQGIRGGILYASVHRLERGEDLARRPGVVALAEHLVAMVRAERTLLAMGPCVAHE